MDEQAVDSGVQRQASPPRLRVRTLLVLVALLPIVGMLGVVLMSTQHLDRERRGAERLQADTAEMMELIEARIAIGMEEVASAVVVVASDMDVTVERLEEMFGQDFSGQLAEARAAVDENAFLQARPRLSRLVLNLAEIRPLIDAGEVSFTELIAVTGSAREELEAEWAERTRDHTQRTLSSNLPGAAQVRFQALTGAFVVLTSAADRALLTEVAIMQGPSPELTARLVDATGSYRTIVSAFATRLGPKARAAWDELSADPANARFERVLDTTLTELLNGETPSLSGDPVAFGRAFIDGPTWARGLAAMATAAAEDLTDLAAQEADDATRALRTQALIALVLTVLSFGSAILLARAVARPARRLAEAANQVQEGRFDLPAIPEDGPQELAHTAQAFNEMAGTLAAVERHAVAMADDVDDPVLREELPGRTGRALQVAMNRIRHTMQVAEQRREELRLAATHDALTGLLNRAAAFEVLSRDLLRAHRGAGTVVALFIDMDGLKPINDVHGHAAGDDALRLTADALREATRASDVVARLGGDEFLVAGVLHPDGAVGDDEQRAVELAERVRASVAQKAVAVGGGASVPLRCTVGIALSTTESTAESLVNEADHALLEAKAAGKDRVGWSSKHRPQNAGR